MKDQNVDDNWQLREEGTPDEKWVLRESEQILDDQWELQSTPAEDITGWQPVEYVKPHRPVAWLLPTVITAALVVVIGYAGYRILPCLLFGACGEEAPPPAATIEPTLAVIGVLTPTVELTVAPTLISEESATPAATPTQVPPPAPSNLVDQQFATVTNEFGVNARVAPNTDATVIRILEQGETLWVFSTQGEWLELFVAEAPVVEDQPLLGTVGFAAAEFFDLETREVSEDLWMQVLAYTNKLPTPTPEPPAAVPVETGTPVTGTVAPTEGAPTGVIVTITAAAGVNVRTDPDATVENIIRLVENGVVLPAIARTADGTWVQVQLPDGVTGWIATEFIAPSGDLNTLPTPDVAPAPTPASAPVTAGDVVTSGVAVAAPYTNVIPAGTPAIIVTVADGVNARSAPVLDANVEAVLPQGAVLPARGRSSDSQWVQIELPTGVLAWVFRDTVTATSEVGALPAVDGGTPTPTPTAEPIVLLPTPTPSPEPTATEIPVTAEVRSFVLPVYTEPSSEGDTILRAPRGTEFVVIGRTAAGDWLQVETGAGVGWVVAGNVNVSGDVTTVPVVE